MRPTLSTIVLVLTLAAPGLLGTCAPAQAADMPTYLPRYDLDIDLDVAGHRAEVRLLATWTNPHSTQPARELMFNAHSHYVVPDSEVGFMAKMLEILRVKAGEVLGTKTPALEVRRVALAGPDGRELPFSYEGDTSTTLVVPLPFAVGPGQSVTVALDITMHLPQKQGRWGQYEGVTCLSNWVPVFAFFGEQPTRPDPQSARPVQGTQDARGRIPTPSPRIARASGSGSGPGWQPVPFVPWHQPFFNEAGHYEARVILPADQELASSGSIVETKPLGAGKKRLVVRAAGVRDFSLLCSARYRVFEGESRSGAGGSPIRIRILAFPEHEFYARHMVRIAARALAIYGQWLGEYPWPELTVAEAFFGWNGNECSTLIMIDERVFGMPHLALGYVEYLLSHEICHQWWYNLVGTNGHAESWMDESMANFFSHRLLDQALGKNNNLMKFPPGLEWLPNIRRDDYRSHGMYATFGKGENAPVVQKMEEFGHLANLFNLVYDKGSRIVGMIEERIGEAAFLDFSRQVVKKYRYRILRVDDYRRELETYTGRSWEAFFAEWLYGKGVSDWAVDRVKVEPIGTEGTCLPRLTCQNCVFARLFGRIPADVCEARSFKVTVWLEQRADCNEPTVLGIALPGSSGYPLRIPILPHGKTYQVDSPRASVSVSQEKGQSRVRVELELPCEPDQIRVDPDQVQVDRNPGNNTWKLQARWRVTPLFTFLEETDLTNAYDRWNFITGPWLYMASYNDAWYTRSTMLGYRAAAYRTQHFYGGVYGAYRTDFRDLLAGADAMWDHWPLPKTQVGFNVERRLTGLYRDDEKALRGVAWGRYVLKYGSSLYLPPMEYAEAFAAYQDNFLPFVNQTNSGGVRYDRTTTAGLHYRKNYLTPYFDPEGGYQFDVYLEGGVADLPESVGLGKLSGQLSVVQGVPDLTRTIPGDTWLRDALGPVLTWLGETRLAFRAYGATSVPARGEFFTMGGGQLFRGFDLAERQGSTVWIGSVEWRVPLATRLHADCLDHVVGLRNVYGAVFYDVGDAYVSGNSIGPVAHALGAGLRLDVSWFSFVERTTVRLDFAKTVNSDSGVQVWFGIVHPF